MIHLLRKKIPDSLSLLLLCQLLHRNCLQYIYLRKLPTAVASEREKEVLKEESIFMLMLTVKTERKMWVENEFYDFRNNHKKGVQSNPFSLHANTKDEAVNGFFFNPYLSKINCCRSCYYWRLINAKMNFYLVIGERLK